MKRSYQEKLKNINIWVEIVNHYWHELHGELYNNKEFWANTLHAMEDQDWWDWLDIEPALRAQHPDAFQRYHTINQCNEQLRKKLMFGKPVTKQHRPGKNFEAFRALMNIKDIVNWINGQPTEQYTTKTINQTQEQNQPTQFQQLFDY